MTTTKLNMIHNFWCVIVNSQSGRSEQPSAYETPIESIYVIEKKRIEGEKYMFLILSHQYIWRETCGDTLSSLHISYNLLWGQLLLDS